MTDGRNNLENIKTIHLEKYFNRNCHQKLTSLWIYEGLDRTFRFIYYQFTCISWLVMFILNPLGKSNVINQWYNWAKQLSVLTTGYFNNLNETKRICQQHQNTRVHVIIFFLRYFSKRSKASLSDLIPRIKTGKYMRQTFLFQTFYHWIMCWSFKTFFFDKYKKSLVDNISNLYQS